ncbi:hypothetical protein ACYULU_00720 [Breznakiellaceae bacterium SP9]
MRKLLITALSIVFLAGCTAQVAVITTDEQPVEADLPEPRHAEAAPIDSESGVDAASPLEAGAGEAAPSRSAEQSVKAAAPVTEPPGLGAEDWYRSNAAGMRLEKAPTRTVAVRSRYALRVEKADENELPRYLRSYFVQGYKVERRTLYEHREPSMVQWVFRDTTGITRVVSAHKTSTALLALAAAQSAQSSSGPDLAKLLEVSIFIERYNEEGLIQDEHSIDKSGNDYHTSFVYNGGALVRADTKLLRMPENEAAAVFTDYFQYTRSHSLRSAQRVYHDAAPPLALRFPFLGPQIDTMNTEESFISSGSALASNQAMDALVIAAGTTVKYTMDERGRVLTETYLDSEGAVLTELFNTWSSDRLLKVVTKTGDTEALTEYRYDTDGRRLYERNYSNGVLERELRKEGEREVEILYRDSRPVLRAVWEDGRKVSEELIRPEEQRNWKQ